MPDEEPSFLFVIVTDNPNHFAALAQVLECNGHSLGCFQSIADVRAMSDCKSPLVVFVESGCQLELPEFIIRQALKERGASEVFFGDKQSLEGMITSLGVGVGDFEIGRREIDIVVDTDSGQVAGDLKSDDVYADRFGRAGLLSRCIVVRFVRFSGFSERSEYRDRFKTLTKCEQQVARLTALGLKAPDIAIKLGKAQKTVEAQRDAARKKMSARNPNHLLAVFVKIGEISIDDVLDANEVSANEAPDVKHCCGSGI